MIALRVRDPQLVSDVAALYVDPRGPYPLLVEHWYDEAAGVPEVTPWIT